MSFKKKQMIHIGHIAEGACSSEECRVINYFSIHFQQPLIEVRRWRGAEPCAGKAL